MSKETSEIRVRLSDHELVVITQLLAGNIDTNSRMASSKASLLAKFMPYVERRAEERANSATRLED